MHQKVREASSMKLATFEEGFRALSYGGASCQKERTEFFGKTFSSNVFDEKALRTVKLSVIYGLISENCTSIAMNSTVLHRFCTD